MTPEDLGNMIGYMIMYISEIQNKIPILLDTNATANDLKTSHDIIDSDMQSMYQLLSTACGMKQVQVDDTQLSTDDLTKMNLLNDTSGIDVVQQSVDASQAAKTDPDSPIDEPAVTPSPEPPQPAPSNVSTKKPKSRTKLQKQIS